ncbi:hypothetical protein ABBQ32_007051 [Trebouxia sp. C0010 RCD-2024]
MPAGRSQRQISCALLLAALCILFACQSAIASKSYTGRRISASSQRKAGSYRADLVSRQETCEKPHFVDWAVWEHGCVHERNVCLDQGVFIVFQDKVKPGKNYTGSQLFDTGGAFYNMPGYLDNLKGTKTAYRQPAFRTNTHRDPPDILDPVFNKCELPLIWWPWWPFNAGDFTLASAAPLHAMLQEGIIDRNVKFTPVLDGFRMPEYIDWELQPFSNFKIETLDDISSRERSGARCWENMLLCKPHGLWNRRPDWMKQAWHHFLKFGDFGQQVVEYYRKHLPVIHKAETTFKVAFIERHHKRRIENYNDLLAWCNTKLELPAGSRFTEVDCVPLNLDHADRYLQTLAEMQTVDVLVGSHGAGLINHMFMRKGTAFIEIVPCGFDGEFHDDSFQVPARVQNFQFGFKLTIVSPMLCSRSEAELGDPDVLSREDWVRGSFLRDQDVTVDTNSLADLFQRILSLNGSAEAFINATAARPDFAVLRQ